MSYYLDESGNTGDLSAVKPESYFRDQRIFALAGVGCEVDGAFIESIEALKKSHRIGGSELKSRQVYDRPRFVLELVEMLRARGCPILWKRSTSTTSSSCKSSSAWSCPM